MSSGWHTEDSWDIVQTRQKKFKTWTIPNVQVATMEKQVRSPARATNTKPKPDRVGVLKQENLEPGDGVTVDQFMVRQGGMLFTSS